MSDQERIKILDKAKKLEALANRGIGGEKDTAQRMLVLYMEKHGISERELKAHRHNQDTFKGLTKEEIYQQFEQEMGMKGFFILGKGGANIMRNKDKLQEFRSKINKPIEIEWKENEKNFSIKGYVNGNFIFDIQKTKNGAVLYPTQKLTLDEHQVDFNSIEEAKKYCDAMKGYFSDIGINGFNM